MKETWSFDQQQQQRKFLKRFKIKEWVENSYCNSDRTWKNEKLPHPSFKVSIASQSIFRRLDCYLDHLFGHLFVSIFYMNLFSGRLDSYLDQADRHDIVVNMGSQYRKRKVGVVSIARCSNRTSLLSRIHPSIQSSPTYSFWTVKTVQNRSRQVRTGQGLSVCYQ